MPKPDLHGAGGFLATLTDEQRREVVYGFQELVASLNCRVYRNNVYCLGCRVEIDAANQAARAKLDEAQKVAEAMHTKNLHDSLTWGENERAKGH